MAVKSSVPDLVLFINILPLSIEQNGVDPDTLRRRNQILSMIFSILPSVFFFTRLLISPQRFSIERRFVCRSTVVIRVFLQKAFSAVNPLSLNQTEFAIFNFDGFRRQCLYIGIQIFVRVSMGISSPSREFHLQSLALRSVCRHGGASMTDSRKRFITTLQEQTDARNNSRPSSCLHHNSSEFFLIHVHCMM